MLDPVLASGAATSSPPKRWSWRCGSFSYRRRPIITPNSLEARRLASDENNEEDDPDLAECAQRLIESGCEYVLVTGTHENTPQVVNTLYGQEGVLRTDSWQRLPGSYHGSGCTLASAIAATIANGLAIGDAVKDAQEYTWRDAEVAHSGPAWASTSPIACSGPAKRTPRRTRSAREE